jgi:hypothetical protein
MNKENSDHWRRQTLEPAIRGRITSNSGFYYILKTYYSITKRNISTLKPHENNRGVMVSNKNVEAVEICEDWSFLQLSQFQVRDILIALKPHLDPLKTRF